MLKTIQITVPQELLSDLDDFLARVKMTRSSFARHAFEEELFRLRVAEMERQDRHAYERRPLTQEEQDDQALWESIQDWGDPWPNP